MERVIEEIEWIDWSELIKVRLEMLDIIPDDLAEITVTEMDDYGV